VGSAILLNELLSMIARGKERIVGKLNSLTLLAYSSTNYLVLSENLTP